MNARPHGPEYVSEEMYAVFPSVYHCLVRLWLLHAPVLNTASTANLPILGQNLGQMQTLKGHITVLVSAGYVRF